ncbi:MAG TPA: flagellar hook protein FlgE [Bryobacteraceae bacterium]|nr:flagellar hook protein FlgE [Bryobacteraceae bacterium]
MSSFSTPLSGLTAASDALDIVGNNLANLNTTGYKDTTISFYDLLQQSIAGGAVQIGGGVSATHSETIFNQGSIQQTGGAFDAAIQGNGFFVLHDPGGATLYTRAGNFTLDKNGNLITGNGQFVQGWSAVNGVINTNGPTGDITIPENILQAPVATANFTLTGNLQANATVGTTAATFSAPIQVFDSLGQAHTLTVTFTETKANTWNYTVDIPGADLTGGTPGTPSQLATGTLTFDGSGNLTAPAPPGQIAIAAKGLADGASDLNMNWNLYDKNGAPQFTQYAQASALSGATQDGTAAAQVTQVALSNGGGIFVTYSDGTQLEIGQLALASIANPDSLVAVGQSNYEIGPDTTTPVVGTPATGGRGSIQGGALEDSTVDIAKEFTNLIVYQRSYQANSKVISTLNQLTQDLFSIQQ